ncbi:MAG: NAD+ synthase [Firmicutes bacterium HGW-Firmicutes-14]|nr:MAG: NAD+ synthase [Firmicutes bacterium HGW-Firmicutes-14]
MKITAAQLNPVVGDIEGNLKKAVDIYGKCSSEQSDLVVFPEMFLAGYPPRDLLEKPWFIEQVQKALDKLTKVSEKHPDTGIIMGVPIRTGQDTGKGLYNSAVLIYRGQVLLSQNKSLLPTYDVFDEARYFDQAAEVRTVSFKGEVLGISVCEDAWNDPELWSRRNYPYNPMEEMAGKGATLFINISASPFQMGKEDLRFRIINSHARKYGLPFIYVNQTGGNDELVFDGRSMFLDRNGDPVSVFPAFTEHVETVDTGNQGKRGLYVPQDRLESVYQALVLGLGDYLRKCGFSRAVVGLSGGIDSAVTCSLAVKALGRENVLGISMPSPYSSAGSVEDSRKLAENLGIEFKVIPISGIYSAYLESLSEHFRGTEPDVTEENIQARIRGNILMAFSNKFGGLLLSTGNKSEMAVGYCTLYGDMSGGLSVISDLPKTIVYELAHYINRDEEIIPEPIIVKPPSAELKPGQLDQDTLPPYDTLDLILRLYLDEARSVKEIIEYGPDPETVKWVIKNVDKNEYKRKQAAPGIKVTTKAFGSGRRMPIAAKYGFRED